MKLIDVKCQSCLRIFPDNLVHNSKAEGPLCRDDLDKEISCENCKSDEKCLYPELAVSSSKGHSTWSVK